MSYIHEVKKIKKGRKFKICDLCYNNIEVGNSSINVVVNHQPEFSNLTLCIDCEGRENELLNQE